MEFNDVLNRRYSCRAFAAQEVEQEKVDRILEAGRMAPTAVNKQPVHIWAVSRPETLEAIVRHQFFLVLVQPFVHHIEGASVIHAGSSPPSLR